MLDFRKSLYERYVSSFKGKDMQFDSGAQKSHLKWCEYKYRPLLEGLPTESKILELGCGPGNMLRFLTRCGYTQVKGIDLSEEQIEIARRYGNDAEVADVFEYLSGKEKNMRLLLRWIS